MTNDFLRTSFLSHLKLFGLQFSKDIFHKYIVIIFYIWIILEIFFDFIWSDQQLVIFSIMYNPTVFTYWTHLLINNFKEKLSHRQVTLIKFGKLIISHHMNLLYEEDICHRYITVINIGIDHCILLLVSYFFLFSINEKGISVKK